jgi:hypothetical protein
MKLNFNLKFGSCNTFGHFTWTTIGGNEISWTIVCNVNDEDNCPRNVNVTKTKDQM